MIAILEISTNKYFDLDDKASLSFNHKNNYFDLQDFTSGDGVVSFNIPDTNNNNLLFKNYKSVAKSDLFEELDVAVFLNGNFQYKGKLGINKFSAGYDCYLLIGKSALHQTLAKKIADIGLPNYDLLGHVHTSQNPIFLNDYTAFAISGRWKRQDFFPTTFNFRFSAQNIDTNESIVHEYTLFNSFNFTLVVTHFNNWIVQQIGWITDANFIFVENYESSTRQFICIARKNANIIHSLTSTTHADKKIPFLITEMPTPKDQYEGNDMRVFYEVQQLVIAIRAFACNEFNFTPYKFPEVAAENFIANDKWLGTINITKGYTSAFDTSNPQKINMMQYNSYWDGCSRHFTLVPMFSLKWLCQQIFDYIFSETGFEFDSEILNEEVIDTYIFNTKALDRFMETLSGFTDDQSTIADVYTHIITSNHHIPSENQLTKVITLIRKLTCSSIKIDYATQKIKFVKFNDIANEVNIATLTDVTNSLEFEDDNFSDYYLFLKDESSDEIFKEAEIDPLNILIKRYDLINNKPVGFVPEKVGVTYDLKFNNHKLYRFKNGYRFSMVSNNQPNSYTINATQTNEYFVGYLHNEHYFPKNKNKKIEIPCVFLPQSYISNKHLRVDANNGRVVNLDKKRSIPETARVGIFEHIENSNIETQHFSLIKIGDLIYYTYYTTQSNSRTYISLNSYTFTAENIYNQNYKTFFETITGRKVQLSAMLTKQQYEEILKNDFFIFQNRRLIFTEMDVNFENINVLNNRFEAKITAYIC